MTNDARGRVTGESHTIDGVAYTLGYTYDAADRVLSIGYPTQSNEVVNIAYNTQGLPVRMYSSVDYVQSGNAVYDVAGGLYFYHARYYDPQLGRFAQPDSLVPQPGDPQALNRYSYVSNNPLRFIDASGERAIDIVGGGGGGGGAGMAGVMLASGLAQTLGQQVSALTVRLAPAANAAVQTWSLAGNQIIAAAVSIRRCRTLPTHSTRHTLVHILLI